MHLSAIASKVRSWHRVLLVRSFLVLSFAAFLTYLLLPPAPPWMSSEMGLIEPITRVSSHVWAAFGIHDFPSVYNKISPNPVAAVPSLHAAYAFLFAWYVVKLIKSPWKYAAWIYPSLIWFGTVYMGEHYIIDVILGVAYAYASYRLAPYVVRIVDAYYRRMKKTIRRV